jgi:1-hydroxy-2-naphthoate dioxygenase
MDISSVNKVDELDTWLGERNLGGHWRGLAGERLEFKPFRWKWADIYAGLTKAADIVPMEDTGRRTIMLRNPSLAGRMSNTIHMSVQCVMPGEVAEAHRHTTAAIRYVVKGVKGAFTVVDGEPFPMETGDLITTPGWTFHDHYNEGTEPVMWLDVLDSRITALGQGLGEQFPGRQQPRDKAVDYSRKTLGHVQASWLKQDDPTPPALRYPWADTEATLTALRDAEVDPDPYDGYHLTYTHPVNGGTTLPTFDCSLQLLTPRLSTRDHRHISTTIYQVFRGSGATVVDGERLEWSQGDILVVPPWSWHHHENTSDSDAMLFAVDDWPTFKALALYREEGR